MLLGKAGRLFHQERLYLKCLAVTRPPDDPRCYAIIAADTLSREHYQAFERQQVVDLPYTGTLYTKEETLLGAWIAEL